MYFLKLLLYFIAVLILETVVLTRLNVFGFSPDLVLVSVIALAVLRQEGKTLFAGLGGWLQDVLNVGGYLNLIIKVALSLFVSAVKDNFLGREYLLVLCLVASLTPLALIIQGLFGGLFTASNFSPWRLLAGLIIVTLYNLIFTPVVFSLLGRINND